MKGCTIRFFTPKETLVLKDLLKAYGEVSAEVTTGIIFTNSEIAIFKKMRENREKKSITTIASDTGVSQKTVSKALHGLEDKGQVKSETVGKSILWWVKS